MNRHQRTLLIALMSGALFVWCVLAGVFWWATANSRPLPDFFPAPGPGQRQRLTSTAEADAAPTWPATWTPTHTPTVTLTPTITPTRPPTRTPTPTSTRRPPPTNTPQYPECECTGDLYDCDDFPSQAAAQACYERCSAPGYGDIHRLDPDKNGRACG